MNSAKIIADFVAAAMEAGETADLTRDTTTMMRQSVRAAGQQAQGGDMPAGTNAMEEPTSTAENPQNDITGADNEMGDPMAANPDEAMGSADDMEDGMGDDIGMDDGMGGGSMNDMSMGDGMDGAGEMSPKHATLISTLQANAMALYNSVCTLINTLSDYSIPSASPEIRKVFNSAILHLNEIKKGMSEILGSPFKVNTYASKMRKYTAYRHAYSLTLDQLVYHFEALDAENDRSGGGTQ